MSSTRTQPAPACRPLVAAIEDIRMQRRRAADPPRPGTRTFTQEELCDVYTSYKGLLSGRIRRVPRREAIMQIADYLDCTLAQRNRLLAAARYPPEEPYLAGAELAEMLEVARQMLTYVSLPAYIITRTWDTHGMNAPLLTLFGLSRAHAEAVAGGTPHMLQQVFDPALPIRARFSPTPTAWEQNARRVVYGFKYNNALAQHDPWYHELVGRLHALPDFGRLWEEVRLDTPPDRPIYETLFLSPLDAVLRLRSPLILLGDIEYPRIITFVPADAASHSGFAALGLSLPEVAWGMRDVRAPAAGYIWEGRSKK